MTNYRPIPGYNGRYLASDCGKIFSKIRNKEMIPNLGKAGYFKVTLRPTKPEKVTKNVHQLIAKTWLGESTLCVNHINGIKTDNRIENLEYVTNNENMEHAKKIGLIKKGENHHNSSLNELDVKQIRKLYTTQLFSLNLLSDIFGVKKAAIWKIVNNRTWRYL